MTTHKIIVVLIAIRSDQSLSRVWLFLTPWITARQASLSITNSQSSLRLTHRVSDAIQPSHPLLSPSALTPNLSQHQGIFQWVNSSHEVAKVLEFQLQHQSFQLGLSSIGVVPLGLTGLISMLSKGLSRVFSSTTVWKHQLFGAQPSLWSNSHIHMWLLEKT